MLDILTRCITPLRAEEETWRLNSLRVAFAANGREFKQAFERMRGDSQPIREVEIAIIHPNAEEWFIRHGIPYQLAPGD